MSLPKLILLDRDGVILQHVDPYILKSSDIQFVSGSLEAIRSIAKQGIKIGVLTNQSPISRKLIKAEFVEATNKIILNALEINPADIFFQYCPHTSEDNCECRKPKIGMLEKTTNHFGITPSDCWMVGDHDTDVLAGQKFGASKCVHLLSGRQDKASIYTKLIYKNLHEFVQVELLKRDIFYERT